MRNLLAFKCNICVAVSHSRRLGGSKKRREEGGGGKNGDEIAKTLIVQHPP